jgi:hypothetical protein
MQRRQCLIKRHLFLQLFSYPKVLQVSQIGQSHASLLSWFVHPALAKPDVMNNTRVSQLAIDINNVLAKNRL